MDSRVLALIPAYNEAERIAPVVSQARAHLPVLVVDDGSRDQTVARAEEAGAQVLRQTPNQGKGAALREGFRWALQQGYQAVITLDADGQHDPAEIPVFLQAYDQNGGDLIVGERNFSAMPMVRRVANNVGRLLFSHALGRSVRDNQSGYRLIGEPLLSQLLESAESGFEFEMEMIVTCVQSGLQLDWVPIRTIYAGESSHIQPWSHTVNFFRVVRKTYQVMR